MSEENATVFVYDFDLTTFKIPFPETDIEWRIHQSGKSAKGNIWAIAFAYVTNRAIMERLDDIVGVENWKNSFQEAPQGGVMCGISININGEWVTKYDGAECPEFEKVKGGFSNAMKRAAVQWGIGRYLYQLHDSVFVNVSPGGKFRGKTKDGTSFKWDPPDLPDWALPKTDEQRVKNEGLHEPTTADEFNVTPLIDPDIISKPETKSASPPKKSPEKKRETVKKGEIATNGVDYSKFTKVDLIKIIETRMAPKVKERMIEPNVEYPRVQKRILQKIMKKDNVPQDLNECSHEILVAYGQEMKDRFRAIFK